MVVVPRPGLAPRWQRAVLKISGEAFASPASDETIDAPTVRRIASEIAESVNDLITRLVHKELRGKW